MNEQNKKVAILCSADLLPGHPERRADYFELEDEIGKLTPAFAAHGMKLDLLEWHEAVEKAGNYAAVLPLLVWDYAKGNQEDFLQTMAQVCQRTNLYNRFDILKWNSNKSYLEDLGARGAPTIPTLHVERATERDAMRAFERFDCDRLVIKPDVGAGAWRQVILAKGDPWPEADKLPPKGALLQPYLESVANEGEYSFVYFEGRFSHALIKKPKAGDYRVQSIYGGHEEPYQPSEAEREQARAVLDVLDQTPLYARVDLIRGAHGQMLLIELEMIEPYLYLNMVEGDGADNKGAQRLARALARRLATP